MSSWNLDLLGISIEYVLYLEFRAYRILLRIFPDFEKCLKDKTCSETTVVNYMNKWGTDCDGDGSVTCYDYARIHKGGRNGCPAKWVEDTDYWSSFTECMQGKN